jgi:hypothetical protein
MDRSPLIWVSIGAVVLLILGSLTNVIGYQTIQSINRGKINNQLDQKELLYQTIVDIANNKDIQQITLKSQISREGLFNSSIRFTVFNNPVLTKNQLKHMYTIGLLLSKIISKLRLHSIVEKNQLLNLGIQKEINAAIEKDATLNGEMNQLSTFRCDCGNENTSWNFPILCTLLTPILMFILMIQAVAELMFHFDPLFFDFLLGIMGIIGSILNCFWYNYE